MTQSELAMTQSELAMTQSAGDRRGPAPRILQAAGRRRRTEV
jgi:hypothetical protein